ncbi:16S rRNA (guanine(527)-N(7))-methyltransferase RsmG [Conexibacter woesei]|uniref:16S rRNA (guanine(527)-N(7))-methyltransferase RsmG n=1 Tax=Conexibacter woesei TaxID=191495 RepID=UPI0004073E4E|nr:16S rRNA (guanine(527)-N(7))-methyltransferase RsmG [Conexibacter woesei]
MAERVDKRIAELTTQWALPPEAPQQLREILDAVAAEPTSITTVRDPAQGVDVHVADSLAGLAVPELRGARAIADLGAGGGFPGLVLAVALPDARVTLVESVGKKTDFLRRTADAVGLANVHVVTGRAERWPEGIGAHDVVTARALAPLNILAEYAAPLLREGGRLIAWKARRDPSEVRDGLFAADVLGLEPQPTIAAETFPGADERHLYVYLKVRPTPARFPRREGMARKRPLQPSA